MSQPLSWRIRRKFWDGFATLKFRLNKPGNIKLPQEIKRKINAIPFITKHPKIPIHNILIADYVPKDETSRLELSLSKFQVAMYSLYPPMQSGLPQINADMGKALDEALTGRHGVFIPKPKLPDEYHGLGKPDLGSLAVAGPYWGYLEKDPDGDYQWDLRYLSEYEVHPDLYSLGVRVRFRLDRERRCLEAYEIHTELGVHEPGDKRWAFGKQIALCAVATDLSLVRHFNWVHLTCGSTLAIASRNRLSKDHPLCRLLWPHTFGNQYSNEMAIQSQMSRRGDFESIFSFTHNGMCKLFEDTYEKFSILVNDPELDAKRRGVVTEELDVPSLENLKAIFDVMLSHAEDYLSTYYRTDYDIQHDKTIQKWLAELNDITPHGVKSIIGNKLTIRSVARLIASYIYMGSVQHELLGTFRWNYQMCVHKQPVRVYRDGRRIPLDIYQRLINSNYNINIKSKKLLDDFSYLGLDEKGENHFRKFRESLFKLQENMEREEYADWKVYPHALEAHMSFNFK